MDSSVVAVSASQNHTFSKPNLSSITLVAGVGVDGDAHSGRLVKHTFLVRKDATQPNLRQVHLIQAELFDQLEGQGYMVAAGELGENITTRDVDLLSLPTGTRLHIGLDAGVELLQRLPIGPPLHVAHTGQVDLERPGEKEKTQHPLH